MVKVTNFSWDDFEKDHGPFEIIVGDLVEDGIMARSWLQPRWDILQRMYRMEPGSSGPEELLPGVEVYPSPLIPSRVDTVTRNVMSSVTMVSPWVSAVPEKYDQTRADDLEEGFQTILEKCDFERRSEIALRLKSIKGTSFYHPTLTKEGFDLGVVAPDDFSVSPTYGVTIETCDWAGHRVYVPYWEVKQRQEIPLEDGGWYPFEIIGNAQPVENRSQFTAAMTEYTLVEIWDGVVRVITEKGPERLRVIYARDEQKLLLCEPFPYSVPWYVKITDTDEYEEFWTGDSVANRLQGFQHIHTTLHNLMPQAGIMGALPPVIVSGGQLSSKLKKYLWAAIIETTSAIQAQVLPISAEISEFPLLLDQVERMADAAVGITPNATGQETSTDTTATETAVLNETAQVSKNSYTANFSTSVENLLALMQEMANKHTATIQDVYGDCLKPNFFIGLKDKVRWAVTGKTPEAMPGVALGKAQALLAMAENPLSTLDYGKVEDVVLDLMRLPVDAEELKKPVIPGAAPGVIPGAGMGMDTGLLPGNLPGEMPAGDLGFINDAPPTVDAYPGASPSI